MKSPRFEIRSKELRDIFSRGSLKSVWKDYVRPSMRKRYIQDPLDHQDFHIAISENCERITTEICSGNYRPKPAIRLTLEKKNGLCRQIVLPDVEDLIVVQRLSQAFYAQIKDKSPSKSAFFEPEDHKFNQQWAEGKGAPSYGAFQAWMKFQKTLFNFTREHNYIVVTDLANFYDFIGYMHLRNIITSHVDAKESVIDTLLFVLSSLLWQPDYMPRIEIGLPQIDTDATRILAHCFLYDLDEYLDKIKKVDFVRFMDDINIGVSTRAEARSHLKNIDLLLQSRQVRLNSGKTKILSAQEASNHFRIKDNIRLDMFTSRMDRKSTSRTNTSDDMLKFCKLFERKMHEGYFEAGNGEKILKRSISIIRKYGGTISRSALSKIILHWPSCRSVALSYACSQRLSSERIKLLLGSAISNSSVDDVMKLEVASNLVEAKVIDRYNMRRLVNISLPKLISNGQAGTYAAFWLASKFLTIDQLANFIRDKVDLWRHDQVLGRLVGSMYPLFAITGRVNRLDDLVNNAKNSAASDAMQFQQALATDIKTARSVIAYVKVPNKSKPLHIIHPKFLMLLGVFTNEHVAIDEKIKLTLTYKFVCSDPFYRWWLTMAAPTQVKGLISAKGA